MTRSRAKGTTVQVVPGVAARLQGELRQLHRPSNVDEADSLRRLLALFGRIAQDLALVFVVHPRTRSRLQALALPLPERVQLVDPLGYRDFLAVTADAFAVLTDSGGIQAETTIPVPCLTLRENTERRVTIEQGTNRLVGVDPGDVLAVWRRVFVGEVKSRGVPELWDGSAGERITAALLAAT